ncbi:MAG: long-chain-fatty-acid--CoA ligase [Pseudomonadota bacterium]
MHGLMMRTPLTITSIMRHAQINHPHATIADITMDNPTHHYTYREAFERTAQLAHALQGCGLNATDRVATLAWNDHRHFELYYGVSCSGYVLHMMNPRLFPEQVVYVINHAEDRILFIDPMFLPLLEKLADKLPTVERYVVLTDDAHMPQTPLPGAQSYESFMAGHPTSFDWPELDEDTASSMCYTSGTTGNPKGVLYSHRSTVLHAMGCCMTDAMGVSSKDRLLPVVPMFHVNAWGVPYAAPMAGADLVLPGPKMGDGQALFELIEGHQVTCALGVPTVWLSLLEYARKAGGKLASLDRTVVGGSACPKAIMDEFRDVHDVRVGHAWGMTETSPMGTINTESRRVADLPEETRQALALKQGRGTFGIEMRIVDDEGKELPWDGEAFGPLQVRGPWVCSAYYRQSEEQQSHTADGWFDTGDVATVDDYGYMQITDRTKDVIKSGGEWISSIELENLAVGFEGVAEAAVIGVAHPKWFERPLLIVRPEAGAEIDAKALLASYKGQVASWWIPDAVAFVQDIPHTSTGKISKRQLREQFADYQLPADGG